MTVPTDVADVTACALGLAFSEHRGPDAMEELTSAAGDRWEILVAARDALDHYRRRTRRSSPRPPSC